MTICPCGGGEYHDCCGPLLESRRQAETAEELMRSRYSAFALGMDEYLWRTWHPRTRPDRVTTGQVAWYRLDIVDVVAGQPGDTEGVVEFAAHYRDPSGRRGTQRERSLFTRRGGRWMYLGLDGDES